MPLSYSRPTRYAQLFWDASPSPGVLSYNIYRAQVSGGPYTLLKNVSNSTFTYNDFQVNPGQTYFYVMTTLDSVSEGAFTPEIAITVQAP